MKKYTYNELISLSPEEQKLYLLSIMETYPGVSMSDIGHGLRARTEQIRELFKKLDLHMYTDKVGLDEKTVTFNKKAFIGFMLSPTKDENPKQVEEPATKR